MDKIGVLSNTDLREINSYLARLDKSGKVVMGVIIPNDVSDEPIEEYSMRVAEVWKLGHSGKQDGLILVVDLPHHRARLEVGRGISGDITDLWAHQILDRAGQLFKQKQYKVGIMHISQWVGAKLNSD
jgi:uncharacterized protein